MADPMTPDRLTEASRLITRAHTEVGAICKDGPGRRWRMSIPAQPDRDSDLILSAGLKAGEDALATVERLRAELADAIDERDAARLVSKGRTMEEYDAIERAEKAEAERDQLRATVASWRTEYERLSQQLLRRHWAWQSAKRGRRNRELIRSMDLLRAESTFTTEVMAGTVLLGADDAIGMLLALTEHLAGADVIGADQVEQVNAGLAKQQAERDRLAEHVGRAQDPDLIRRAIADPGAYVQRKLLDNSEPAETVPAWSARAVIAALDGTEPAS